MAQICTLKSGVANMISEIEERLIHLMVDLGADNSLIVCVTSGLENDEQRLEAIETMEDIYAERGKVTEEEMLKTMIVCKHPN